MLVLRYRVSLDAMVAGSTTVEDFKALVSGPESRPSWYGRFPNGFRSQIPQQIINETDSRGLPEVKPDRLVSAV